MRANGFYWVDVTTDGVTREVCEWQDGNWYIAGVVFSEDEAASEMISNINEAMVTED